MVDLAGIPPEQYSVGFYIYNELGQAISFGVSGAYHNLYFNTDVKQVKVDVGPLTLTSGKYRISLGTGYRNVRFDRWEAAINFTIVECQPFDKQYDLSSMTDGVCILQQRFYR